MTVVRVWGVVDGMPMTGIQLDGEWYLPIPRTFVDGDLAVEAWAQDEHGGTGYLAGVLVVKGGGVKCFRLLTEHCTCRMLPAGLSVSMDPMRPGASMAMGTASSRMAMSGCIGVMMPHMCPRMAS